MNHIGIMQGRLVPPVDDRMQAFPRDHWKDEFPFAVAAGVNGIEWIYDRFGSDINPLNTEAGMEIIRALTIEHKVFVRSLCADYFMEFPLLRGSNAEREDRFRMLAWLLERCGKLGIGRIVLPFVDNSAVREVEELVCAAQVLERALGVAEANRVEMHLESSLSPALFADLLRRLPYSPIKVNYDSGNSTSLGYDPMEEFDAYGERIGSVHIKDRMRGGGTVHLGAGDTDFQVVFNRLREIGYKGDFVLQVARGIKGDEVNWARRNVEFVSDYLKQWI
jgi:L-ribulose-5-phosphate 3-epimerase